MAASLPHTACQAAITCALLSLALMLPPSPGAAAESGPQGIVRQFCQADGLGQRVTMPGWSTVAPLVEWPFEPAWDGIVLITGYAVGSPRPIEGTALAVDVRYDVVGQVSALGMETAVHVETIEFLVHAADERGWRIIGPPPPPHLFAHRVDIEGMRRSLATGSLNFVPNSLFIWRMFRSAGWEVAFERTADLIDGSVYRAVDQPGVGDLVVYLRNGSAYHVGLLEAQNQVVSSTLNAGIVRTTIDAFAGDVKYLRLVQPEATPTAAAPTPTPAAGASRAQRTPTPIVRRPTKKRRTKARPQRKTKPSKSKRVKKRPRAKLRQPTPVARRKSP